MLNYDGGINWSEVRFWLVMITLAVVVVSAFVYLITYKDPLTKAGESCNEVLWTEATEAPNGQFYCVRWDTNGEGHIAPLKTLQSDRGQ